MSSGGVFSEESFKVKSNYGQNAAIAGTGLAFMSSSGNNARCPINDMSLMCQLSRTVSITSMIIYLIVVFSILIYFLYMLYKYMKVKK